MHAGKHSCPYRNVKKKKKFFSISANRTDSESQSVSVKIAFLTEGVRFLAHSPTGVNLRLIENIYSTQPPTALYPAAHLV